MGGTEKGGKAYQIGEVKYVRGRLDQLGKVESGSCSSGKREMR